VTGVEWLVLGLIGGILSSVVIGAFLLYELLKDMWR
jgi:hypothetical protein